MNIEMNFISNVKRSLIPLLIIPLIIIGCIYIYYGEILEAIIGQLNTPFKLYQLKTQLLIFQYESIPIPLRTLPRTTVSIGYYSVIMLYVLFFCWLFSFAILAYLKLSWRLSKKVEILLETIIITIVFFIFILPGLKLWMSFIGGISITVIFLILALYWIYEQEIGDEEK